jgi:GT2 family glycosyltransferase
MSLSIVIVNYNTRGLLRDCLQSLRHNGAAEWETIVVDNHSLDDSVALVRSEFPGVHIIPNSDNVGFSKANNHGIQAARGDYILLLNSDTVVLPGTLQTMTGFMAAHPEAGAVGCRLRSPDGSIQASAGRDSRLGITPLFFRLSGLSAMVRGNRSRSFVRRQLGFALSPAMRACLDAYTAGDSPLQVETLSGACLLLRRKAIAEVGLLDENFFMYLEDLDYCIRLRRAGWRLYYLPGAELLHLVGKSSGGRMRASGVQSYESLFYFYRKHYPARTQVAARLLVLSAFCCRWVWSRIRNTDRENRSEIGQVIALCCRGHVSDDRPPKPETLSRQAAGRLR